MIVARRTSKVIAVKTIAKRNGVTGKFSISFDMRRVSADDDYICAECESAAVFDTAAEAHAGGDRAVKIYNEAAGMFPNMCEKF